MIQGYRYDTLAWYRVIGKVPCHDTDALISVLPNLGLSLFSSVPEPKFLGLP